LWWIEKTLTAKRVKNSLLAGCILLKYWRTCKTKKLSVWKKFLDGKIDDDAPVSNLCR
jgi:hypothetical protein